MKRKHHNAHDINRTDNQKYNKYYKIIIAILTFSNLKVEVHRDIFLCVKISKPVELKQKHQMRPSYIIQ